MTLSPSFSHPDLKFRPLYGNIPKKEVCKKKIVSEFLISFKIYHGKQIFLRSEKRDNRRKVVAQIPALTLK